MKSHKQTVVGGGGMHFNQVLPFGSGVTLGKPLLFGSSTFLTCKMGIVIHLRVDELREMCFEHLWDMVISDQLLSRRNC